MRPTIALQPHLSTADTDLLASAIDGAIADFCGESGWAGEFTSLSRFWVAPASWRLFPANAGFVATFAFAIGTATKIETTRDDAGASAALVGGGDERAVLLWQREVAGSGITFAKLAARQNVSTTLGGLGFERNGYRGRSYHLPLAIDAAALARGDVDEAVQLVRAGLQAALAAAPLFDPLIDWVRQELEA